ncbi:LbtU family siderophore porin [Coxiella endosymbiont of Amblyomma nuttalli]|uniref:LbtU family siderophore porin n=1 Tax=Coxiella endosymbiont of Amblyomma nuttalli TaxID=2749996 RepID=UPI003F7AF0B0
MFTLLGLWGLCISSAFCATFVGNTTATDQQIKKRISCLQAKDELRERTERYKQKRPFPNKRGKAIHYCCQAEEYHKNRSQQHYQSQQDHAFHLDIGPYLNKNTTFDGSKLIINIASVREDSRLLLRQYQATQKENELSSSASNLPRVILTGKLEGQTSYRGTYISPRSGSINFSGVELGTYVQSDSWVSGYMVLNYDPDEHRNGSRLFINRAFITIGNLSQFPLYTSIGQVYVPFGRYSSLMVTTPVTQVLGRTRARTLTFGYQQTGSHMFHAEVYGFQGLTNNLFSSGNNQSNEWGTDIGYEFSDTTNDGGCMNGEVGTGYISNLADSQGIQATVFSNKENLRYRVPALSVYCTLDIRPIVFLAEYIGAVKRFDVNDINFANQGARPTAFHTEASCTFKVGSKSNSIGVGYGHTSQALALGLPQDRYNVFYNINIWRNTNLALEYCHDVSYSVSAISARSNFLKSDNIATAQFDLFF